jgi:hypothetical protein
VHVFGNWDKKGLSWKEERKEKSARGDEKDVRWYW